MQRRLGIVHRDGTQFPRRGVMDEADEKGRRASLRDSIGDCPGDLLAARQRPGVIQTQLGQRDRGSCRTRLVAHPVGVEHGSRWRLLQRRPLLRHLEGEPASRMRREHGRSARSHQPRAVDHLKPLVAGQSVVDLRATFATIGASGFQRLCCRIHATVRSRISCRCCRNCSGLSTAAATGSGASQPCLRWGGGRERRCSARSGPRRAPPSATTASRAIAAVARGDCGSISQRERQAPRATGPPLPSPDVAPAPWRACAPAASSTAAGTSGRNRARPRGSFLMGQQLLEHGAVGMADGRSAVRTGYTRGRKRRPAHRRSPGRACSGAM
jgi:hypothetical protein